MNVTTQIEKLETYILRPGPFDDLNIPRDLDRGSVAQFITTRISPPLSMKSLKRLENVVTFYLLQEVCGHLQGLLSQSSASFGTAEHAVIARTIAANCPPPAPQQMASYAQTLLSRAKTSTEMAELLDLQDRIGPGFDPTPLANRLVQLRALATSDPDPQAKFQIIPLDQMYSQSLPRIQKANEIKAHILASPDRKYRLLQLVKIYLGLEYGYAEYLTPWAIARLKRETWGVQPADQATRKENPGLLAEVAKVFETTAANLTGLPGVDPADYDSLRVTCLRAAHFFGQTLSAPDRAFIAKHGAGQVDMLSND
jgi:hypothetical protein